MYIEKAAEAVTWIVIVSSKDPVRRRAFGLSTCVRVNQWNLEFLVSGSANLLTYCSRRHTPPHNGGGAAALLMSLVASTPRLLLLHEYKSCSKPVGRRLVGEQSENEAFLIAPTIFRVESYDTHTEELVESSRFTT
jgi:hypothetical protein